ncbi:class-A beta-lactamase family protein [Abortiporus biennis]
MSKLSTLLSGIIVFAGAAVNAGHWQQAFHLNADNSAVFTKEALTPSVSAFIENLMKTMSTPGVSVGVVHLQNGTVRTEFGNWGTRSEEGDRVVPETLFRIGSCSKAFTSAAMAILMDDFENHRNMTSLPLNVGVFNWQTKITDLLPLEWKLMDEWASSKANLRDIFSHVTGLPMHDFSYEKSDTPIDLIRRMKHLKPTHELREEWSYNNQMYTLASYIISVYSGRPFVDFVKERIFEPLGMISTTYVDNDVELSENISQAFTTYNNSTIRRVPILVNKGAFVDITAGPGGIVSNTDDMHKWLAMMLNEGIDPYTNRTIIPLQAYREITFAHSITSGAGFPGSSIRGYGLGWGRSSYQGHETITHSGGVPGFTTQTIVMPYDGLAVIAIVNQESLVPFFAAARIIEDYLDLKRSVPSEDLAHLDSNQLATIPSFVDIPGHFLRQIPFKSPSLAPNTPDLSEERRKRPLALPIEEYAGTYVNAGYGSFTLCAPEQSQSSPSEVDCSSVLSAFAKVFSSTPSTALYGPWARGWSSHIRLTHRDKETFSLSVLTLFPHGYGRDKSPFSASFMDNVDIPAVFVLNRGGTSVEGLAVPNGFQNEVSTVLNHSGRDLKKDSFVYFTKVG